MLWLAAKGDHQPCQLAKKYVPGIDLELYILEYIFIMAMMVPNAALELRGRVQAYAIRAAERGGVGRGVAQQVLEGRL